MTEEKESSAVGEENESAPMLTMDDYLQFDEQSFGTLNHGDIVDGVVVRVDPDEVLVDVGAKAEGIISNKELGFRGEGDNVDLKPGDKIKVYVLQSENEEGNVVLSLRRARAETTWITAAEKQTAGEVMEAEVREQNKGGLIVNVLGLRGFLPSSQVARAYSGNLEQLVGQRIPVKILEVNRKRNRLIVSQKAAEDEDRARRRDDLFGRLAVGDTVKGTVSGLTTYGAFVDIGGADGLIHISELSWDRVSKVSDVLQVGDEVSVKVIKLDADQSRISLSLRQLQQDPWEQVVASLPVGSQVDGQVTKTKKYGAFLQIVPGIEGLLHISELSWDHVEKTEDVLKVGDDISVKVIGVDTARRRISLSLKQLTNPPAGYVSRARESYEDEEEDDE
ncbi:MAG: 30S ribosomal protein S1 [Candidatus Dormibacteraceae bacterium]